MKDKNHTIDFGDFLKVDIRVGTIVEAKIFEKVRKPAYQLWIDFGDDLGIKKTSAQITKHYGVEDLPGKQVVAVINFAPKQIANFMSEVLVLGLHHTGGVVLLSPDVAVENGGRIC